MSVAEFGDRVAKNITAVVLGIVAAGALVGYVLAPGVNTSHPAEDLQGLFGTSAQVIAAMVLALALFQSGPSAAAGHGARRFLSPWVFPVLGVGLIASIAGLSQALPTSLYRWLFALVVGTGGSAIVSTHLVGAGNLDAQRKEAIRQKAAELDPGR